MDVYRFSRLLVAFLTGTALVLALALLLSPLPNAQAQPLVQSAGIPRYVSPQGSDNIGSVPNDCASSIMPCRTVQHALNIAQDGDEIRVAAGTYTGVMTTYIPAWGNYITATVIIAKNIASLLGGYSSDFTIRNPDLYETTLSAIASPGDWVIFITGTTTLIDGFTVTGSDGGGIQVNGGAPIISHNRIQGNRALKWGGGIYVTGNAAPIISANKIYSNSAENGGGIYVYSGAPIITGNVIISNVADKEGGGVWIGSTANIINNIIAYNTAKNGWGGGILGKNSVISVVNNLIFNNSAVGAGGGLGVYWNTKGWISGNQILRNHASDSGGGVVAFNYCKVSIVNNVVKNNSAPTGGGIYLWSVTDSQIISNAIEANSATQKGGGGILIDFGSGNRIEGNIIHSNNASWGGGLHSYQTYFHLINNVIVSNSAASYGGGIYPVRSNGTVMNNTVVRNSAATGGGLYVYNLPNQTITVTNSIFWDNVGGELSGNGYLVSYSDVKGGAEGIGNISADPEFVDPARGDFHLRFGSPAMNAGTNEGAPPYDKDGVPRPQGGRVDMGAYEVVIPFNVFLPVILKN